MIWEYLLNSKVLESDKFREIAEWLECGVKPLYLSHYVRAISDCINDGIFSDVMANRKRCSPEKKEVGRAIHSLDTLFSSGLLRFFEIKLCPVDFLEGVARVRILRLTRNGHPYGHIVAKIEFDSFMFEDNDLERDRKLRLILAHELGHIFLEREHILRAYKDNTTGDTVFDSSQLDPDDPLEINAWIFAITLIQSKDNFYSSAASTYNHCCKAKIWNVCLDVLITSPPAKLRIRRIRDEFKNNNKVTSCKKCSN